MTERTTSPSQDAHGTAREINPSPNRVTLSKEVEEELRAISANRSAELYDGGYIRKLATLAADLLTRISAERDSLNAIATETYARLREERDDAIARAERAESERDSERERAASLGRLYEAECARAINAESELSALKARVAEVLEPFALAAKTTFCAEDHDPKMGRYSITLERKVTYMDFRQASNLHATLTGEQK